MSGAKPPDSESSQRAAPPQTREEGVSVDLRRELEFFSGPLPPPQLLVEYNKVYPECAKEIVQMAREEQRHRHQTEDQQVKGDVTLAKRGQLIGGALALAAVLGGIYLIAHDKPISGLSILSGVVVAFGGAFIYDRYQHARSWAKTESQDAQKLNPPGQTSPKTAEKSSATQT